VVEGINAEKVAALVVVVVVVAVLLDTNRVCSPDSTMSSTTLGAVPGTFSMQYTNPLPLRVIVTLTEVRVLATLLRVMAGGMDLGCSDTTIIDIPY
jgi:hypothetical protein